MIVPSRSANDSFRFSELVTRSLTRLHTLELVLIVDDRFHVEVDNSASQVRDAFRAIERLECLRDLRLRCSKPCVSFDLSSASVEVVDCHKAHKSLYLNSVNCPRLRELHVNSSVYGNGIRRLGSDGRIIWEEIDYHANSGPVRVSARGNT